MIHFLTIDSFECHEELGGKVGDPPTDSKASLVFKAGESFTRDSGRWNNRELRIDKANDRIDEVVIDFLTSAVLHQYSHKLSDHIGHGSART